MATIVKLERPRAFEGIERNECGVFALSAVLCIEYATARDMLSAAGRKPRHGTFPGQIERALVKAGHKYTKRFINKGLATTPLGRLQRPIAARVLEYVAPRGHFIVGTTTHWFAVVDGVIYDNGGLGTLRGRLECSIQIEI